MKTRAAPIQRCACGKKPESKPAPARGFQPDAVQRQSARAERGFDEAAVHPGVLRPSSGGAPLPPAVREKMEAAFGHDFRNVRVHHGGGEAESIGARAYARGSHLHFAPGQYQPHTPAGQRILGHELAHVVQQRAGRVPHPGGAVPINADPALELEADAAGARAAAAWPAGLQGAGREGGPAPGGPAIQPMLRRLLGIPARAPSLGLVSKRSYRTGDPSTTPLITGYTHHGQERTDERDIDPSAQYDAVHTPTRVIDQEEGKKRYEGDRAAVVLSDAGKVVTSWPKSKDGKKSYK